MRLTGQEAIDLGWGDCNLWGYAWMEGARDLWLDVEHASAGRGSFRFTWVAGFKIAIDYAANRSGPSLSWDVKFSIIDDRWATVWNFAGEGSLEFTYQDVQFVLHDG